MVVYVPKDLFFKMANVLALKTVLVIVGDEVTKPAKLIHKSAIHGRICILNIKQFNK